MKFVGKVGLHEKQTQYKMYLGEQNCSSILSTLHVGAKFTDLSSAYSRSSNRFFSIFVLK